MSKLEKFVNLIFFLVILVLILSAVNIVFGATLKQKKLPIKNRIETRFAQEIDEATMSDTTIREKKQKIIREEIEKDIIVIPIVKIEVIKLDILKIATLPIELVPMQVISILSYSPQELALAIQKLTPVEIEVLRGRIVSPEVLKMVTAKIKGQEINKLAILVYDVSYQARRLRKEVNYAIANDNFKKYLREGNIEMVTNCLQTAGVDSEVIETLMAGLGREVPKLTIQGFGEYVWDENAYIVKDYNREVKQNDLAIFDITKRANLLKALEFVEKNKGKLDAVIIGWDNSGANNYDELDFSKYPEIMKNHEYFFSACKAVAPNLPVGLCITYRENTMYQWLNACNFSYNFLAVFNITKMGANFGKIQKRFPNQRIMVGGMNAGENAEYGGTAYKNYIEKLKKLGFIGSIFYK